MKITRCLNHLTYSQLQLYAELTDVIIECNAGVMEEILLEVTHE